MKAPDPTAIAATRKVLKIFTDITLRNGYTTASVEGGDPPKTYHYYAGVLRCRSEPEDAWNSLGAMSRMEAILRIAIESATSAEERQAIVTTCARYDFNLGRSRGPDGGRSSL